MRLRLVSNNFIRALFSICSLLMITTGPVASAAVPLGARVVSAARKMVGHYQWAQAETSPYDGRRVDRSGLLRLLQDPNHQLYPSAKMSCFDFVYACALSAKPRLKSTVYEIYALADEIAKEIHMNVPQADQATIKLAGAAFDEAILEPLGYRRRIQWQRGQQLKKGQVVFIGGTDHVCLATGEPNNMVISLHPGRNGERNNPVRHEPLEQVEQTICLISPKIKKKIEDVYGPLINIAMPNWETLIEDE